MSFIEMLEQAAIDYLDNDKLPPQPVAVFQCDSCRVQLNHDTKYCDECQADHDNGFKMSYLQGRNACGSARDSGRLLHLRLYDGELFFSWTALCGAKPGRRSGGWAQPVLRTTVCERCKKKYAKIKDD